LTLHPLLIVFRPLTEVIVPPRFIVLLAWIFLTPDRRFIKRFCATASVVIAHVLPLTKHS
jgi:hypothetical protein